LLPQQDLVLTVRHNRYLNQGATLVELIISIVIISIALVGILSVVNLSAQHSADPVVRQQAIAIAESYLEEILLLPIVDPDGTNSGETRASFDNIADYDGLNNADATDQNNNTISGLENYTVTVSTNNESISGVLMTAVTVSVVRPGTDTISLTGYRATY
jgi:MSHA pilin protein MshD